MKQREMIFWGTVLLANRLTAKLRSEKGAVA
jgi:hypothetical protein